MAVVSNTIRRLTDPLRWRHNRLTLAAILLLSSVVLMGAGLSGLLMTGGNGPVITNVGQLATGGDVSTATSTPLPGPPRDTSPLARMIIEKINVDAPIITLGLDENSAPQVPDGPYDVAWYDWTSRPGWGSNAVFSGHVDWTVYGRPVAGVFYYLHDLGLDDIIKVVLEDGTAYSYKVTANRAIEADDPETVAVMNPTPDDMVTLITCGGTWIPNWSEPQHGHYTHRQVVQAALIGEEPPPFLGVAP
jgi:LPXTG-site transpeptidase (sortase) family protein